MRINLAKKNKGLADQFIKEQLRGFMDEYDFANIGMAMTYITDGKQGLSAFVSYLTKIGFNAEIYYLEPNRDLFSDVGERWSSISRTSPSFGFIIPETDPKLVEFKLRTM